MLARLPEWLRSSIVTFFITFVVFILTPEFDWSDSALLAAASAAARTVLSALLPGGSFGVSPVQGDE